MRKAIKFGFFGAGFAACVGTLCLQPFPASSQTTVSAAQADATAEREESDAEAAWAALRQLLEQQQASLVAIERLNRSTEAAFKRNIEVMDEHLGLLRQAVITQHSRELDKLRNTNRASLAGAVIIFAVALLGTVFVTLLQVRALHRLTGLALAGPMGSSGPSLISALGPRSEKALQETADRFFLAVERLEGRLAELEAAAERRQIAEESAAVAQPSLATPEVPAVKARVARPAHSPHIALTIGNGEALGFLPEEYRRASHRPHRNLLEHFKKMFHLADARKAS